MAAYLSKAKNSLAGLTSKVPMGSGSIYWRVAFVVLVMIAFTILLSLGSKMLGLIFQPSNPFLIKGMINAANQKMIPADPKQTNGVLISRSQNQETGIEFSYSVWINISNLNASSSKQFQHVFSKGDNLMDTEMGKKLGGTNGLSNAPGLYIAPGQNDLHVFMNTFGTVEETVVVKGVPLNKWIHVVIRVQGVHLDVYINGLLTQRKVLESVPLQNNGNVYTTMNGGYTGYLSDLRYFERALQPGDILDITNRGPNLNVSSMETSDLSSKPPYMSYRWYFQG